MASDYSWSFTTKPGPPVADFSANRTSGVSPLGIAFTDATTGYVSAWQWDFGDAAFGLANSTQQSPVYVYASPGTYTVTLTAISGNGTSTMQKTDYVGAVAPTLPVAGFSANRTLGLSPLGVLFSDASTGYASSWQWDFGDAAFGLENATGQNPVHVYASPGTYTVTLTAINANGTSTMQKAAYVAAVAPTLPVAGFR